jgi:hypothetical protein
MALKRSHEFVLSIMALAVLLASMFAWRWEFMAVFVVLVAFIIALLLKA